MPATETLTWTPTAAEALREIEALASGKGDNGMTCLSKLTKVERLARYTPHAAAILRASRSTPSAVDALKAVAAVCREAMAPRAA